MMKIENNNPAPAAHARGFVLAVLAAIAVAEFITIACRIGFGRSAAEFNATKPPLLLQIHHMFWSVPFILTGISGQILKWDVRWAWVLAIALIASDLIHHFIVLPLWVGNTGWHWP